MNTDQVTLTASSVQADPIRRTISGLVAPWGSVGYTSAGPTIFAARSLDVPAAPARVKLLIHHGQDRAAVGVGASFAPDDVGLWGTFSIPPGLEGDEALEKAANGLRDGLSVGVAIDEHEYRDGAMHVARAHIHEVSLVTIPAFADARVSAVTANRKEAPPMTTPEPAAAPAANTVTAAAAPATPPPPAAVAVTVEAAAAPVTVEAQAPAIIPARTQDRPMSLYAAAAATLHHIQQGSPLSMLQAALKDLVPADDVGEGLIRPMWVGELWRASLVQRPVIDAIGRGRLTGLTVVGFQFDNHFQVDPYTGNKTAIPSHEVTTHAVTATASRYAGGLDIDRVFIDLGDVGLIETLYQQGTDSYRNTTEKAVVDALLEEATVIPAAADLPAFLVAAGAAAMAIGATISFMVVSADVWSTFAGLKGADVPWWLNNGDGALNAATGAGNGAGLSFAVDVNLPANTILAGDRRAATWYEVDPPIRARAENIPNGGIDIGVFGYGALIVNFADALFTGSITAPEAPAVAKSSAK